MYISPMRFLLLISLGLVLSCSTPEQEAEIVRKEAEVSALEKRVERSKATLDSVRREKAAAVKLLDSLDMAP